MTRMFSFVRRTWNPIVGCHHNCYYGKWWARIQAKRQIHRCKLCYSFIPHLHEERLNEFPKSGIVFVVSMGDLWGTWVPDKWIIKILEAIQPYSKREGLIFFFETKNPERYLDFVDIIPPNSILSTTIETNRDYEVSKAPIPFERYIAIIHDDLSMFDKHVSIEPIMDFDHEVLLRWIIDIKPKLVSIGYNNYGEELPEPSVEKTLKLINELKKFTEVEKKKDRRGFL